MGIAGGSCYDGGLVAPLHRQFFHDIPETRAADLVVCQDPAVVDRRKHGVGGRRILRFAVRSDLYDPRLNPVFPLRGLRNLTGELRNVWALVGTDDGETAAVLLEPVFPTRFEGGI